MMFSAVILAAGESRRMGANKLLLFYREKRILEHVIETVIHAGVEDLVLVSGRDHELIEAMAEQYQVRACYNSNFSKGQGSSIKIGVKALHPESHASFFLMGDQPQISSDTLKEMMRVFQQGSILIPTYEERRGSPVLFDRCYYPELQEIEGDLGGKVVIEKYPEKVRFFPIQDERELWDIDDPETYQKLHEE